MHCPCVTALVVCVLTSVAKGRRLQSSNRHWYGTLGCDSRLPIRSIIQVCCLTQPRACWTHAYARLYPRSSSRHVIGRRTPSLLVASLGTTPPTGAVRDAGAHSQQEALIGAIVVPSQISQLVATAVRGEEGWMEATDMWHITEYQAKVGPEACRDALHAVHLLSQGCDLLNFLCKGMPQSEAYDLRTMLTGNFSEAFYGQRMTVTDKKVLRRLRFACEAGHPDCSLWWIPGLSQAAEACARDWEDDLYEAWQRCKSASPAPRFTFVELFAGIGGFRLGLEPLGGRCVFACEKNLKTQATYLRNFQEVDGSARPLLDATCVDTAKIAPFDILTAGFPCQSFTTLTKGREGLESESGKLFYEVVRVLRDCQPAAALLENVQGLLTLRRGADFEKVVDALREVGYAVGWQTVSAEHFVPQKRIRVYIVCVRRDLYGRADKEPAMKVQSKGIEDGDYGGEPVINWLEFDLAKVSRPSVADILEANAGIMEEHTLSEDKWAQVVGYSNATKRGNTSHRLVQLDGPAKTLRSTYRSDAKIHSEFVAQPGLRPRFFTTREVARLMGFPDSFVFGHTPWYGDVTDGAFYRQLGNAVVPAVIQEFGQRILATLQL